MESLPFMSHVMIAVKCVTGACFAIATKTFNTSPNGEFCGISTKRPAGCKQQPEIYKECDPEVQKFIPYLVYVNFLILAFSFTVIIYSMIRLIHSVLNKDMQYGNLPTNPTKEQLYKYNEQNQLLRETMLQATMYTSSWQPLLSYTARFFIRYLQ